MESLRLESVKAEVGGFVLSLDGIRSIAPGEIVGLLGPSGSGKSTLLNSIAGFVSLSAGSIWSGETRLDKLPPEKRRSAYVFQRSYLFPHLTVRGNIEFGLRIARWPATRRTEEVAELSRALEISELLDRRTSEISEGQAQRVALARALAPRFPTLLLDEPFSALDSHSRSLARRLVAERVRRFSARALLVTHQWEDVELSGTRAWYLRNGIIEEEIEAEKLREHGTLDLPPLS